MERQTKTAVIGRAGESAASRVRQWTDIMSEAGRVEIAPERAARFSGSIVTRPIGDLLAISVTSSTFRLTRDELAGPDHLFVNIAVRGDVTGTVAGRGFSLAAGAVSLVRRSNPMDVTLRDAEWLGLAVPIELLEQSMRWQPHLDAKVFAPRSMQAVFLRAHIMALSELADPLPSRVAAHCEEATLSLLKSCLGGHAARPPHREPEELRRRIRRYIVDNLSDPSLGWNAIAREFALSRSTLYRAIGKQADFAALIRGLRLRAAHRQIASADGDRLSIREIGLSLGFAEERTFRRAFSREFGYSPAVLRSQVRSGQHPRAAGATADLKRWFDGPAGL